MKPRKFLFDKVNKIALDVFIREMENYVQTLKAKGEIHEINIFNSGVYLDIKKLQEKGLELATEVIKKKRKTI